MMASFGKYQQKLIDYLESMGNDEAVEFFDKLCFADYGEYGAGQCDVCGHPLRYAMVIRANYIQFVGIFPDYDNDVSIGRECFRKITKLAWLRQNMESKFNEWKTCIKAIRKGDKDTAKRIMMTVKEAKQKRREMAEQEHLKRFENKGIEIAGRHDGLISGNDRYNFIFELYGKMVTEHYSVRDEHINYQRPTLEADNEFLESLFNQLVQNGKLSEKQEYWFNRLVDEIKEKDTPEEKAKDEKHQDYVTKVGRLKSDVRLSAYDEDFVDSLFRQGSLRRYSDRQMEAIDKLCHRYRKQLEAKK